MRPQALPLLLDNDEPRDNDRTLRIAATSTGRWRRARGRRGSRTALRLEEIRVVRLWINRDRLRDGKCIDRRYHCVLIGRILMDDGAITASRARVRTQTH